MGEVTNIEIRAQRNLGLAGTWRLCVKGISHRLLRSVLTLAVVTLAVAFFMFLLSENAFVAASASVVREELAAQRFPAHLLARLYTMPSSLNLAERLGQAVGKPVALKEFAVVSGSPLPWIEALANKARQESDYLRFFGSLPPGKRLVLVQKREGREVLRCLQDLTEQKDFEQKLAFMKELRLPGGMVAFRSFLASYSAYLTNLNTLEQRWQAALSRFAVESRQRMGAVSPEVWLAEASPDALRDWAAWTAERGFEVTLKQWVTVGQQLRQDRIRQAIFAKLSEPEIRAEWRRVFRDRKPLSTQQKMLRLNDPRVEKLLGGGYNRAELEAVSVAIAREQRFAELEGTLSGRIQADGGGGDVLSSRQAFLLFISFLVCAVGVGNAMLMSITERFREIATMKCLGATDRYILSQFMLEAAIQGFFGGLLGMIIGFLAALTKGTVILGGTLFVAWPGYELCVAGTLAAGAGILLSVLASMYPAWAASRMAPMDAMRVE